MKKLFLTLMPIVLISSCVAYPTAWFEIDGNDSIGGTTFYVDPTSIRKSGDKAIMWTLINHNSVQEIAGDKFLSQRSQEEYKCNTKQVKMLYYSWHSENMGGGHVVYAKDRPHKHWSQIASNSVSEGLWKFACGR